MYKIKRETIKYCACGCGEEVVTINKNPKIINRFIKGHQCRGENYFGYLKEAPLCKCGCGKKVNWSKEKKVWHKYVVRSHSNRGENYLGFLEESPFCSCGCGEKTTWNKKRKIWNEYVTHHNFRGKGKVPWNKDKKGLQVAWNKGLTKEIDKRVAKYAENVSKYQLENPRPVWNKGLTKETDERVAKLAASVSREQRENPRELTKKQLKGLEKGRYWCKGLTSDTDERVAERGRKVSDGLSKAYLEGRIKNRGYGKSGHYFSKKNNKELYYRSSYELVAYKILEQLSRVKYYEIEPFRIQYEYRNSKHHTIPDILITYIDGGKELIEVKPEYKLKDEKEQTKLKAMKNYSKENNMLFSIWTEKELKLN